MIARIWRGRVITLSFWDSLASIEAFAASDVTIAKYYPEDDAFLLDG